VSAWEIPPTDKKDLAIYNAPLSLENLGHVRHYHAPNIYNGRLDDVEIAIEEARLYAEWGGRSIIDVTSIGIGRNSQGLARISREGGLNVVMGASYYLGEAHPADMEDRSEDQIVDEIVRDVTVGVDGTKIKAGVIGEVGCSWPMTENELKVLRASARAQRVTGAPLLIHPGMDQLAPLEIIDIVREAGGQLDRMTIAHIERTIFDRDVLRLTFESGCFLAWDQFGREVSYYSPQPSTDFPNDATKMDYVAWAINEGFGDKVLVAHDICYKDRLLAYGGHGLPYILQNIVPRMQNRGISRDAIDKILVDNPARAFTFGIPSPE
jgi:phosphotriesterase-related protein